MTTLERWTGWLVGLYLFLLPWQTRWFIRIGELHGGAWEFGSISLYATDLVLATGIIAAVGIRAHRKHGVARQPISGLDLSLLALGFVAACSYFWSVDKGLSLYGLIKVIEGLLLVWLVGRIPTPVSHLARWFVAGATIQGGGRSVSSPHAAKLGQ